MNNYLMQEQCILVVNTEQNVQDQQFEFVIDQLTDLFHEVD